ncbi:MAG: hypothetical protein Q9160_006122 [Pyrenula sp. 1 TL-2023]
MAEILTHKSVPITTKFFAETPDSTAQWFFTSIGNRMSPEARNLFETYSKLPAEEVESHVFKLRDSAFEVRPYPCIGVFQFLQLHLKDNPAYPQILESLKSGCSILDIGSCFSQDLRWLAHDGAPTDRMYATDLVDGFFDLSYDLFRDRDTFKAKFTTGDCLKLEDTKTPENQALLQLVGPHSAEGGVDIIHAGLLLHLFDYPQQLQAIRGFISVLSKSLAASIIVGNLMGNQTAGPLKVAWGGGSVFYQHNEASFRRLWKEAEDATGTEWDLTIVIDDFSSSRDSGAIGASQWPEGGILLDFVAKRR